MTTAVHSASFLVVLVFQYPRWPAAVETAVNLMRMVKSLKRFRCGQLAVDVEYRVTDGGVVVDANTAADVAWTRLGQLWRVQQA